MLSSVQWFNPVVYLLRGALQDVHEYQADNVVLEHGFDAKSYQYMILAEAVAVNGYYVTNNLNIRSLKNRITMMNRKNSPFLKAFKVVYAPALVLMYLSATAVTVYDGKPELGNFTLEGYVTPGLRDVAYLVSISDENLSEVAETRKVDIKDRKFSFTTNFKEPRLAKIQAIFENGVNAGGIIPLLIVPDEQAHLKVKNGTYELTGETGFYQQYGYACDLIKNASLNGIGDRMPVIVKYFKEHLSDEGCVMAYLNSQVIPTPAILANMDSTVRSGRLRNVFDNQMYGAGFSKSDCKIPASVSGETSLDNLSVFNEHTVWKSTLEITATDDFGIVSYQVKSWPLPYVNEENQASPMDWLAKPNSSFIIRSSISKESCLTLLVAQSDTVNENIRRIPVIWMADDSCHVEIGNGYYEITGKSPFYKQYADAVKYGKSVAGKKDATKKLTDYLKKNSTSEGTVMAFIANGFLPAEIISTYADDSVKNGQFKKLFDEGYLDKGFTSESLRQREAEKERNKNLQILSINAKNGFKGCSYKLHTYSFNAIYDDANSAPASDINMFGNNPSYVERGFLPTGPQLKVLVAQSDDVNENIARIPIIWMPNDSCHVEIGNDYYEITGKSLFYKQYADAVNFANSVAGKNNATEQLTAYFVKNSSSDGAVMAFIANGYLPAKVIESMASKYVKKGKFKALFEGGYLNKGFLQESEANGSTSNIRWNPVQIKAEDCTLMGTVGSDITDCGYLVSLFDESFNVPDYSNERHISVTDKSFIFSSEYDEVRLALFRAVFPDGSICNTVFTIMLVPGEVGQLSVHNGYYELTGESGFYKQYGEAIKLFRETNLSASPDERNKILTDALKQHSTEDGWVIGYIDEGVLPSKVILAIADVSVKTGRFHKLFETGHVGPGFRIGIK